MNDEGRLALKLLGKCLGSAPFGILLEIPKNTLKEKTSARLREPTIVGHQSVCLGYEGNEE